MISELGISTANSIFKLELIALWKRPLWIYNVCIYICIHSHTYTHMHTYKYIYTYVCACVCICACAESCGEWRVMDGIRMQSIRAWHDTCVFSGPEVKCDVKSHARRRPRGRPRRRLRRVESGRVGAESGRIGAESGRVLADSFADW